MKNLFKLFGTQSLGLCAIALVVLIGFSFAACNNGTTDDNGSRNKIIWFNDHIYPEVGQRYTQINFFSEDLLQGHPDVTSPEAVAVIKTLTKDDIVFTPADVVTIDTSITYSEYWATAPSIYWYNTIQKSGTVTVSIKDKGGYKFVKVTGGNDRQTFTKE